MAVWRKILISGSDAHVTAITASQLGDVTDKARVIFRDNTTGEFLATGSIFYSASSVGGNQLFLDKVSLRAFNISASGLPNSLSDNAQVIFRDPQTSGLKATSSLYYNATDNQLAFEGTYSGSFTGDGSGLTGVIGTLAQPIISADGIASGSGVPFSYDGTSQVSVAVDLEDNSGLEFAGGGLRLATSLPGDGLYYPNVSSLNYSTMSVAISPNGTSGLTTASGQLAISSSLAGSGLTWNNAVISVEVASNGGLVKTNDELKLAPTLDGTGLSFGVTGQHIMNVDDNYVVTSSNRVTFRTGSENLTLAVSSSPNNVEVSGDGFSARLIDNPVVTYGLNNTLTGNFTFNDDVNVEGNFTVSGTLISTSIETENLNIADQFILLNSGSIGGSGGGDGGFVVLTSNLDQGRGAFLFYDSESARWGVSDKAQGINSQSHRITEDGHAALVTTTIVSSPENVLLESTPLFGSEDRFKMGQLSITTAASSSESSVYIYA